MDIEKLKVLYPNLSDVELSAAGENLDRYLLLAWEIYGDLKVREVSPLTIANESHTISAKVDSPQN